MSQGSMCVQWEVQMGLMNKEIETLQQKLTRLEEEGEASDMQIENFHIRYPFIFEERLE